MRVVMDQRIKVILSVAKHPEMYLMLHDTDPLTSPPRQRYKLFLDTASGEERGCASERVDTAARSPLTKLTSLKVGHPLDAAAC